MNDIGARMSRGAVKMVGWRFMDRAIGLVSTVILARLLVPADFGLVALAMSVIAVIELARSFSFEAAIIQRQDCTREHLDTAWTLNILLGVGGAVCLFAVAYPASIVFDEPRLMAVILALAPNMIVQSIGNIGVVHFQRDLEFGKDLYFLVAKRLVTFVVTITLAYSLRNYWALIAGTLVGGLLGVAISYRIHPFRPRFCLTARQDLIDFSKWMLLNNLILFIVHRSTHFIIARIGGAAQLGIFTIAHEIGSLAVTDMAAPINRAAYPGYSRSAGDRALLVRLFVKVISLVAAIVVPITVILCLVADDLVAVVLGPKWAECVPLLQLLAAGGGIAAAFNNIGYALLAVGRARTVSMLAIGQAILVIGFSSIGMVASGVVGACVGLLFSTLIGTALSVLITFRALDLGFNIYASQVWRSLVAGAVTALVLLAMQSMLSPSSDLLLRIMHLGIQVAVGGLCHCLVLFSLWFAGGKVEGAESYIWERLWWYLDSRARVARKSA